MDVEMTKDKYSEVVFFTGDSDFLSLVTYLRNGGKKVFVFSSKNNVSRELRHGSDGYIEILDIAEDIWGRDLTSKKKY